MEKLKLTKLWKEYVKERQNGKSIEVDGGIIFYSVDQIEVGEWPTAYILDIFIPKEYRSVGRARRLMHTFRDLECMEDVSCIVGYVRLGALNCDDMMKLFLYYGFKIQDADEDKITLSMEV